MMKKKHAVTDAQRLELDRLTSMASRTERVREKAERLAEKALLARQFSEDVRRAEELVERR